MPRPGWLAIPQGELAEIEDAARAAAKAVSHLRLDPAHIVTAAHPCGHRVTTACTPDRCTVQRV